MDWYKRFTKVERERLRKEKEESEKKKDIAEKERAKKDRIRDLEMVRTRGKGAAIDMIRWETDSQ